MKGEVHEVILKVEKLEEADKQAVPMLEIPDMDMSCSHAAKTSCEKSFRTLP